MDEVTSETKNEKVIKNLLSSAMIKLTCILQIRKFRLNNQGFK